MSCLLSSNPRALYSRHRSRCGSRADSSAGTTSSTRSQGRVTASSRSRYYPDLGNNSLNPAMIDKVKAFAEAHIAAGSRRAANTTMSTIAYRMKVRSERLPVIDAWLKNNSH
jgi:hypothetical protein